MSGHTKWSEIEHKVKTPTFREAHAWSYGYSDGLDGTRNAAKHWDATNELVQAYERGHEFGTEIREKLQDALDTFADTA